MGYLLEPFADIGLDEALLNVLIAEHDDVRRPRLDRLWRYYRNALAEPSADGGSADAPEQKSGLPARLTEIHQLHRDDRYEREIVIENDIAWRIHTLVDFMFPAPPTIVSLARDAKHRGEIEELLNAVIEASGGVELWQTAALLGSVYGSVDFIVSVLPVGAESQRFSRGPFMGGLAGGTAGGPVGSGGSGGVSARSAPSNTSFQTVVAHAAARVNIETVEAPRAIPLLSRWDYRTIDAFIIHHEQVENQVERAGFLARLRGSGSVRRATVEVTEIITAHAWQRYENGSIVAEGANLLGRLPVVHVQNLSQPLAYEGLSDVEPLIPLQDELNTRLSDRANRVTMQSFRMWLGKGIDGFTDRPVGPGQMWVTDDKEASIESFGGDAESPSEQSHIEDLREALDRASGVTPAAAGHIKAKVGNLTSENALRISLMGTLAKTKRKRVTYGAGMQALCELVLHALDVHGIYRTEARDRRVETAWQDPLPVDESRRLDDALKKRELGIPLETLRTELGYTNTSAAS